MLICLPRGGIPGQQDEGEDNETSVAYETMNNLSRRGRHPARRLGNRGTACEQFVTRRFA